MPIDLVTYDQNTSVEVQFSQALERYQLDKSNTSLTSPPLPFDFLQKFKNIAATQALQLGEELQNKNDSDSILREQFENWNLETKLWILVEELYSFRLSNPEENNVEIHEYSSLSLKQEKYLSTHPKLKELLIIINWIQQTTNNSNLNLANDYDANIEQTKWHNTKIAIETKEVNSLLNTNKGIDKIVDKLDIDAPLRTNQIIDPKDQLIDLENYAIIYKLLLGGKIQEAIDYANNTGNFALALILVGGAQDYIDPVLDGIKDANILVASGIKHKLLWKETVYKLSQQKGLNDYERLIYNYLSGGDITENLKASKNSWEESLLLYAYQLLSYKLQSFILENNNSEESLSLAISIPKPQSDSIEEILNILSNANSEVSLESRNPLRIISGAIMIDKFESLIENLNQDLVNHNENILRILVHLSIFIAIIKPWGDDQLANLTAIITLYISMLSDTNKSELIPVYLSFIPDEKDARETYSMILSSITDKEQQTRQLQAAKKLTQPFVNINEGKDNGDVNVNVNDNVNDNVNVDVDADMVIVEDDDNNKLINVLRRTVERVMIETAPNYERQQNDPVIVKDDESSVDEIDFKLYRAVEWFYENQMYGDAINATIVVIRRFLINGKLASLKKFAKENNFKQLISDYDIETIGLKPEDDKDRKDGDRDRDGDGDEKITEDTKQELIEYTNFIEALKLIDDWKLFIIQGHPFKGSSVNSSLEKTEKVLKNILQNWLLELNNDNENPSPSSFSSSTTTIVQEFRILYIPYLIIELLTIYENARAQNWKYIKQAYQLINEVADDQLNDYLDCFIKSGRIKEFMAKCGELSIISCEQGITGIFSGTTKTTESI